MKEIKEKTINGFIWSFLDSIFGTIIQFIISLILARILDPKDFGTYGILFIFISLTQVFVDSGFSHALIRKKKCSNQDYNTVYTTNLIIAFFGSMVLLIIAKPLAKYFNEHIIEQTMYVLSFSVIISAFGKIQQTIYTKQLDFKKLTKISAIANSFAGFMAIVFALNGFGIWSLIILYLIKTIMETSLLWFYSSWKPKLKFYKKSFIELFEFGYKLLISSLLDAVYHNSYYFIIGKYFSVKELGFYNRADKFQKLISQNISSTISKVAYPSFSNLENKTQLKIAYQKTITHTTYITFILLFGLLAVSKPMILLLIGKKWLPTVPYLQLLIFVGMLYPIHAINLSLLNVLGRSDLYLKLEIIKKIIAVPVIIIGVFYGIKIMIIGMIFNSIIAYFLNSYWTGKFINYTFTEQLLDILPSFIYGLILAILVYYLAFILPFSNLINLIIQICFGGLFTIFISEIFKPNAYLTIKQLLQNKLNLN